MTEDRRQYLTVPKLTDIPWLVHGFGDAGWSEVDFLDFAASRDMRPVIMRQAHSDTVHRLDAAPAGKLEGDAQMTNVAGLLLVIRTADCLPVFLVDAENLVVAAVHCGWRGTQKRILERAILDMARFYGSKPGKMLAALGPCIGSACYEVGPEVRESFLRAGFPPAILAGSPGRPRRSLLDLRAANIWLLEYLGFQQDNILDSGSTCTHCEQHFLSYRRDPGEPRRMYNFIGLFPAPQ